MRSKGRRHASAAEINNGNYRFRSLRKNTEKRTAEHRQVTFGLVSSVLFRVHPRGVEPLTFGFVVGFGAVILGCPDRYIT
jgi:hypothetical protein